MTIRASVLRHAAFVPFCLLACLCATAPGCDSESPAAPGSNGQVGGASEASSTSQSSTGGSTAGPAGGSTGASTVSKPACTPASTDYVRPHDAGNYDNRSCNAADCHESEIGGGWVYSNIKGPPWVGGATITFINADGSEFTKVSAEDGFFALDKELIPPYQVCVSKCPGVDCNLTTHTSADCQTSNCHGNTKQRIYVSGQTGGASGTGGSSSTGDDCVPAAPGGPYTHVEMVFGLQPCSGGGCHGEPKPVFKGGYVYDGPDSTTTVAEATVTLTPKSGSPVTAVTGPDGMFFWGTVSATSKAKSYTAPFTACVSKCPLTVCSPKNSHTTTDDCQNSGCHDSEKKIYLE